MKNPIPLMTSKNAVKTITASEAKKLIKKVKEEGYSATIKAEIEFKKESTGLKLARKFNNLAKNPDVKLEVTFKKIN